MKNIPQKIYLNLGEDAESADDFKDFSEVTWCTDKINDNDIQYILPSTPDAEGQATNTESDEEAARLNYNAAEKIFDRYFSDFDISDAVEQDNFKERVIDDILIAIDAGCKHKAQQLQATKNNVAEGERKIYVDEISTAAKMYKGGEITLAKLVEEINELLK